MGGSLEPGTYGDVDGKGPNTNPAIYQFQREDRIPETDSRQYPEYADPNYR